MTLDCFVDMGHCREVNPTLHAAVTANDYYYVRELIADGEDVEERDTSGRTPFLRAAFLGQTDILQLLWKHCDISAVDDYGRSALHLAAKENQFNALTYLLRKGCSTDVEDDYGRQPLHLAAYTNSIGTLQELLKYVNVNVRDNWLRTPLHIAAKEYCYDAFETLLLFNANVRARDDYGRQPHHLAAAKGSADILEKLLDMPKVKLNARDYWDRTPLHLAYLHAQKECQNILLDFEADTNARDINGAKPSSLRRR